MNFGKDHQARSEKEFAEFEGQAARSRRKEIIQDSISPDIRIDTARRWRVSRFTNFVTNWRRFRIVRISTGVTLYDSFMFSVDSVANVRLEDIKRDQLAIEKMRADAQPTN